MTPWPTPLRLALLLVAMTLASGCAAAGILAGAIGATSNVVSVVKWSQDREFQAEANIIMKRQTEAIEALVAEITATRQTIHQDLDLVHEDLRRVLRPGP